MPSGSRSTTWLSQILSNSVRGRLADMRSSPYSPRRLIARRQLVPAAPGGRGRVVLRARSAMRADLPRPAAQIIQLRPPHVAAAHHGDLGDDRRIERKHALHALAVADLAHREVAVQPLVGAGDHDALERLGAGALAFDHPHRDPDGVAGREVGNRAVGGEAGDLVGLVALDDVHGGGPFV